MSVPAWVKAVAVVMTTFGALFAVPLSIGAAFLVDGVSAEHTYTSTAPISAGGMVAIDSTNGSIKVIPGNDGEVVVEEHDSARALTRRLAQIELGHLRTQVTPNATGVAVSTGTNEPFFSFGVATNRSVLVRMPATANLRVSAASADLAITGIQGDVSVESAEGRVSMRSMDATGNVTARLASGDIEYDGAIHGGHLDLRAISGTVRVYLPRDTNAHYDATTVSGGIVIDRGFPIPVLGRNGPGENATGDLGSGKPGTLTLATVSGAVYLRIR